MNANSLPNGWKQYVLAELVHNGDSINYGVVQPGNDYPGGIGVVRAGDLTSGRIEIGGLKRIDPAIEAQYSRSRLVGDEILIACVGSIGAVALATPELAGCNIARAVARIRCNNNVDRNYLARYLASNKIQQYFASETRTVAQPTLNIRQIKETPVPLPPFPEQKRIAAILDQADGLRRKRQQALALTDQFLRSTFLDLFGDPVTNPKGWPMLTFGDVCESRLGQMLDEKKQVGDNPRPYMRNINVQWGRIDLTNIWEMDFDSKARKEFRLEAGDILVHPTIWGGSHPLSTNLA